MKEEYYSLPHKQIVNQPSLDNHMLPLQTGTGKLILSESCLEFIWSLEMLLGWFIAPISRVKGSCKLNKGRMLPAIMISRENTLQNSSPRQSVHNI